MAEKKNALLIFTKPPIPGIVKTRMTTEYGGFLTMEQAARFYKSCFYDICEMSMQALMELQQENDEKVAADPEATKITYDFFCSTTPADSLPQMEELFHSAVALNDLLGEAYSPKYKVLSDSDVSTVRSAFTAYESAFKDGTSTDLAQSNMKSAMSRVRELLDSRYASGVLRPLR